MGTGAGRRATSAVAILVVQMVTGCTHPAPSPAPPAPAPKEGAETMKLEVNSTAFKPGEGIPARHTCQGDDLSPALSWSAGPAGTAGYALIMDDPDAPAGDWVHWLAWGLTKTELAEGAGKPGSGLKMGRNSWGKAAYGGPCPPSGTHRYCFKVYAVSAPLSLPESTDQAGLLAAMQGKVLAQGELMGTYQKTPQR